VQAVILLILLVEVNLELLEQIIQETVVVQD
jgi:hypothetical protein